MTICSPWEFVTYGLLQVDRMNVRWQHSYMHLPWPTPSLPHAPPHNNHKKLRSGKWIRTSHDCAICVRVSRVTAQQVSTLSVEAALTHSAWSQRTYIQYSIKSLPFANLRQNDTNYDDYCTKSPRRTQATGHLECVFGTHLHSSTRLILTLRRRSAFRASRH